MEKFTTGGAENAERSRLFLEHHIIGGGYRKNFQCPLCGGVDRERWQLWVLSKYTEIFRESCRILHFAPEPHISEFIAANPNCDYYTGDIIQGRAMHVTDILNIQYKDETFDYVIMNHVLEHIEDMGKAVSEVKRVLKPAGKLILSFPICADCDTLELPNVKTPEERLQYYGQEDHVRLFGRDYLKIIEGFGFNATVYSPKECCDNEEISRYGFIEDDVLMVCEKV
ncbi:MAG: class I SAM-dependent methyltransferase [Selenomonadaceae bacterium]|nr:class I SAM-dependent methyltransferase [Selenomonadaceae bacterium]